MSAGHNPAAERQVQAADPAASTWLSANAGSGKTRVLIDRVARLLLQGVSPQRILCLTYTKAAATEMQNRLFERLGGWAMREDEGLRVELRALGISDALDASVLNDARRLFARAIETPGGLRIQTIHAFCAALLRRFPLEAGVSPQFTELDDRAGRLLREDLLDEIADALAPEAMESLARVFTGEDLSALAEAIARNASGFARPFDPASLGMPPGLTAEALRDQVYLGGEAELLAEAASILATGSPKDRSAATKLTDALAAGGEFSSLTLLESAFLFGSGASAFCSKAPSLATKDTAPRLAHLQDRLNALGLRVEAARPLRLALRAADRAAALHQFAAAFLPLYSEAKTRRGVLDFDDLIAHAKALLTNPEVAQWVLFRLDGGIDHILVDEAQDTSPDQWKVIELLAQELTAGEGARDARRTLFVVGDPKQSIYSFQGADVSAFGAMRQLFHKRLASPGPGLTELELEYSFRSSPAILRLVDLVFADNGESDLGQASKHIAFRETMPGRIELWPHVPPGKKSKDGAWYDPVDLVTEEHHANRIAEQVADRIVTILASGHTIPTRDGVRAVQAGDFLILVRRRNAIFHQVIRACKSRGLPIAGADRLKLGGEVAVRDLTALLAFLALPEDDLSLATLLRSPLFNWTEAELFRLAQPRPGYLWQALRGSDAAAETRDILQDLLGQTDFLRPFELLERMLTRHDGRRKLLARLGEEAEDGIDALLGQALSYEEKSIPSLTGFLTWLQGYEVEIKRQADGSGGQIRVMTVHGAKGLEAPIVILPDTADQNITDRDPILRLEDGSAVWNGGTADAPQPVATVQEARKRLMRAESMRLLYVALTRAQCWLMIGAAGDLASRNPPKTGTPPPAWYDLVESGMRRLGADSVTGGGLVFDTGGWPVADETPTQAQTPPESDAEWLFQPAPTIARPVRPQSPSDLGGAKALAGDANAESEAAKQRGTALHLLLQHLPDLPADTRRDVAARLLDGNPFCAEATEAALRVIAMQDALFALPALTEVAVTADLDGQPLYGTIDRLVFAPDRLIVIDYKSNAQIPSGADAIPEGILRQMRAYIGALQQIHPGKTVAGAILWTGDGTLMPVPT